MWYIAPRDIIAGLFPSYTLCSERPGVECFLLVSSAHIHVSGQKHVVLNILMCRVDMRIHKCPLGTINTVILQKYRRELTALLFSSPPSITKRYRADVEVPRYGIYLKTTLIIQHTRVRTGPRLLTKKKKKGWKLSRNGPRRQN